jgi:simple sugar transport system permease protein
MRRFTSKLLAPLAAILLALILGGGLIAIGGVSPLAAYGKMVRGATGLDLDWTRDQPLSELFVRPTRLGNSLTEATPLILAGLAIALPYACGLFNIGAEGQLLMGGLGATLAGLNAPASLPAGIQVTWALFAGFLFGAGWGFIPGWLRVHRQLNEIITTIMLNFIAFWLISYLVHGPMKDTTGFGYPWSRELPAAAHLARVSEVARITAGFPLAVAMAIAVSVLLRRTTFGYQLRAIGANPQAARFAGLPVERALLAGMSLGGGLAGLAGACVIMGVQYRLSDAFSPGYGYDAIAIMFVGQGNPLGVLLAGVFFGALRTGAETMELAVGVPKSIATVVQSLALVFAVLSQSQGLARWWARHQTAAAAAKSLTPPAA